MKSPVLARFLKELFLPLPAILQWNNSVEYQPVFAAALAVGTEISMAHKLEFCLRQCPFHKWLQQAILQKLHRIRVNDISPCPGIALRTFVVFEQLLVQIYICPNAVTSRYPVERSFHFPPVKAASALRFKVIGTAQLSDLPVAASLTTSLHLIM